MEAAKHTPTPWRVVNGNRIKDELMPFDRDERDTILITTVSGHGDCESDKANAAFIVKAVNSHYQLVAALQEMMQYAGIIEERCDSVATDAARKALDAVGAEYPK